MPTITTENREIIKSFRTTHSIINGLKELAGPKVTESDIINTALEEYLKTYENTGIQFKNNNSLYNKYEYFRKKALSTLEEIEKNKLQTISSPKQVAELLGDLIPRYNECAYILYLSPDNRILKLEKAAEGTEEDVNFELLESIKSAAELSPCHLIHVHTHPNSTTNPSPADVFLVRNSYFTYAYSRIRFADHVIINEKSEYFSFDEHGYFKAFDKEFKLLEKEAKIKWFK